jgi:dTDP-4-dehydrorhamnose reductase
MRILAAGWHGQIARGFMQIAPGRSDIAAFAIGRPGLDICDPRGIERALCDIEPDVLINLAGYTDVDGAEREPDLALALNCEGARLLSEAAARRKVPIIHVSSAYVFDGRKSSPYTEADEANPSGAYGRSRAAGERAVQAANPKHIILRTGWIFSPYGRSFVSNILQRAQLGQPLKVVDDQYGSPTYAPHLVDAILAIALRVTAEPEEAPWGTFHVAGVGTASWFDVAGEVLCVCKPLAEIPFSLDPISSTEYAARHGGAPNFVLDCSKVEQAFNVKLPAWRTGVRECVENLLSSYVSAPKL